MRLIPTLNGMPWSQVPFQVEHCADQDIHTWRLRYAFSSGETVDERIKQPDGRVFVMRVPARATMLGVTTSSHRALTNSRFVNASGAQIGCGFTKRFSPRKRSWTVSVEFWL